MSQTSKKSDKLLKKKNVKKVEKMTIQSKRNNKLVKRKLQTREKSEKKVTNQ